jgi:adenylate cyclase
LDSEINSLVAKIGQITDFQSDFVDDLNRLSELQLKETADESLISAIRGIESAIKIAYVEGEAKSNLNAGIACSKLRKFENALGYFSASLKLYEKLADISGKSIAFHKLGNTYYFTGKYPEAIYNYNRAADLKVLLNDQEGAASLYSNLGGIYSFTNNYSDGIKSLFKALQIFEERQDESKMTACYTNIGFIYESQGDFNEALIYYGKSLAIHSKNHDLNSSSDIWNNMGNIFLRQSKFAEAKEFQEKALEIHRKNNEDGKIANTLSNIANVFKAQVHNEMALDYYFSALKLFEKQGDKRGLIHVYYNIGELYFITSNYEKSEFYLESSKTLAIELDSKEVLKTSYEYLAKVFAQKQEYEKAYLANEEVIKISREITEAESSKKIAQITLKNEIEQREKDALNERIKNEELTRAFNSLDREKKRSDELLLNILPSEVAEELKQFGKATAKHYKNVTVFFSDFVEFSKVSELLSPQELVDELNACFSEFDRIVARYDIEKIKTIGDAYVMVSGCPHENPQHAIEIVKAAMEIRDFMVDRRQKLGKKTFGIRIGVNSGEVVAGVVGLKKFVYDIWGDDVNISARMEQNSLDGRINVSDSTYQLIKENFNTEFRGEIEAKNKGSLKMYFVSQI